MSKRGATAILLAGGQSTRMGTDKARLPWGGTTLLQHIHAQLTDQFDEVILASGTPDRYADLGLTGIADTPLVQGPMAGIIVGLEAARHDRCYLHPCDTPDVSATLLDALFNGLHPEYDAALFKSAHHARPHPLCALYRRGPAQEAFLAAANKQEYALYRAISPLATVLLPLHITPTNLNAPHDLSPPPPQHY